MSNPDWQAACVRLWGEDWIAPLSEVLGVSRRTVERWRSGESPISQQLVDEIVAASMMAGNEARLYGAFARRLANGERTLDLAAWLVAQRRTLDLIYSDLDDPDSLLQHLPQATERSKA